MTISEVIYKAWAKSQGEVFSGTVGDDDYNYLLTLANGFKDDWTYQKGVDWFSLYEPDYEVGTITADSLFDFDLEVVRKVSQQNGDTVRILHLDGVGYTEYTIVPANQLRTYSNDTCTIIGGTIRFAKTFLLSDPQFGGTLLLPVYLFLEDYVNPNDPVTIDNPNWLVYQVAADVALHDILRKDTAELIQAQANSIMESMIADNESQLNQISTPWRPFSNVPGTYGDY